DIVAGPDGNLWVTAPGLSTIFQVTTAAVPTAFSLQNTGTVQNPVQGDPYDITVGPDGNLWFKEYISDSATPYSGYAVGIITTKGVVTQGVALLEDSNLNFSGGITAGPDKLSLWLANTSTQTSIPDSVKKIAVTS